MFEVYDTFVEVYITTDYYPGETSWVIVNDASQVIASGGPYSTSSTLQAVETVCLYTSICYDFVIYDAYGDGICCSYGNGQYEVKDAEGNQLVFGNGDFALSETTNFCTPAFCDTYVDVCITTDDWGSETTWEILNDASEVVASGGPYANSSALQPAETVCLNSMLCYDFVIYDAYGDGICCSYGNGQYEVKDAEGNQLVFGNGEFGESEAAPFCAPPPPATCNTHLDVYITTDDYGSETTWEILNDASEVVASGGPYSNSSALQPAENVCLFAAQCYDFVIYDAYGDGICCSYGNGQYEVKDAEGNQLVFGNGDFALSETTNFCLPGLTYYSTATGALSSNIWATTAGGAGSSATFDCTTSVVIQDGHIITNDIGTFSCSNLSIETTGSLDMDDGLNTLHICGDLDVDGALHAQDSRIHFQGSVAQNFGGDTNTDYHNITIDNANGVLLQNDQRILGGLELLAGAFDVNGNNFTFASNSTSTGRFASIDPASSFVGNATCQIYASGGSQGWRMLGQASTGTVQEWQPEIEMTGFPGADWPTWGFTSILSYDETVSGSYDLGFIPPGSIDDVIAPGTGRFVFFNGPVTFEIDNLAPNLGEIAIPVSYTNTGDLENDGWCLAANSYQATIDWDSPEWTKSNVNNMIGTWDNELQQWAHYSGSVGVNGGSRYLAPQQGFWIKANSTSPACIYNAETIVDEYVSYIRETEEFIPSAMTLRVSIDGWTDETALVVRQGASDQADNAYDGFKMKSTNPDVPSLYTVTMNGEFEQATAINAVQQFEAGMSIPLHLEAPIEGDYVLSTDDYDPAQFGTCLVLNDLLTGNETILEPGINITVNAGPEDDSHRFNIVVQGSVSVITDGASCANEGTGSATAIVNVAETATVNWHDEFGQLLMTTADASGEIILENLFAGDYSIEVLDNGMTCGSITREFTIEQASPPEISLTQMHVASCNSANDGYIHLELSLGPWEIEINNDGNVFDSFTHEGGQLEIPGLSQGEYVIVGMHECGNEHVLLNLADHNGLMASFEGPEIIDLAVSPMAEYLNTSIGLVDTFEWNLNGVSILTEEIGTYSFTEPGDYVFSLSISNGFCSDTFEMNITVVDSSVEIGEFKNPSADNWVVWQNGDQMHFDSMGEWEGQNARVQIFASNGQQVLDQSEVINGTTTIQVAHLAAGVYHLRVSNKDVNATTKKVYLR